MTTNSPAIGAEPLPAFIHPHVSLLTILLAYLQAGFTAFGSAITQKLLALVSNRKWLSAEEIDDGFALVQLYPGPMMVDFTAYVGYKLRGVPGAIVATTGFILPAYLLMLGVSVLYFNFNTGNLPWVQPFFVGLEAIVVGIVAHLALDFGARVIKGRVQALIAVLAFGALLYKVNPVLIIAVSLALGMAMLRPAQATALRTAPRPARFSPWIAIGVVTAVIIAVAVFAATLQSDVGRMALSFFKIGSVAFGNGVTIMPLVQADVVDTYGWLSQAQFTDGIALGQITPGPGLITATFVGYKLAGFWGATLATFAIFSPSFAMTLIFTEVFTRLRSLRLIRGAMAGVLASFVGLLVVMALQLGATAFKGPAALTLAAGALVAVRYFKLDVVWVFAGGLVLWGVALALGIG